MASDRPVPFDAAAGQRPAPYTEEPSVRFPEPPRGGARDPRIAERIGPWTGSGADVVLIGVPDDAGVERGGGRPGAAAGPDAIRKALRRFGTTYDLGTQTDFEDLRIADAGDLIVAGDDSAQTHERLSASVERILRSGAVCVVLGGGNDASFGSIQGLCRSAGSAAGINVDAHFDVREVVSGRITSGTPYRRVLEQLPVPGSHFTEFAAHPAVNSRAHHEWLLRAGACCLDLDAVRARGVDAAFGAELERLARLGDALFVSIDLDVFAAADAPGVSAPGADGLRPREGRAIALSAGRAPQVRLFELMELNPHFDQDARTARLCALLLCAFFAGVRQRPNLAHTETGSEP
ncbi:MAG TPA: formimidoylglutamase [Polyangiaceae bacterium]|nr:formimidoylglutamase [Polyangiaceae bacterium]